MCQLQKQLLSSSLIYWTKGPGDLQFKQLTDLKNTSHLLYHQSFQLLLDITIIIIIYYYYFQVFASFFPVLAVITHMIYIKSLKHHGEISSGGGVHSL